MSGWGLTTSFGLHDFPPPAILPTSNVYRVMGSSYYCCVTDFSGLQGKVHVFTI